MPTNLALDPELIEEAKKIGGHRTKREAVNAALDSYIKQCLRERLIARFGTIDFDPTYDYKAERRRR
ncbi:MAG TPA: type II toxin-antitoxin system VapB family antitoxin [Terriglobales bacterium]|nr:type II toxin-antitoxin system VapB family antitoxin [Terriglobales bacterium]